MTLTPARPPAGVPAALRANGLWRCGFCTSGNHRSCPSAVRVKDRVWLCYCPECTHPVRCLDCGNPSPEDLNRTLWGCVDKLACDHRLRLRRENSDLWRQLQEHRVKAISDRRRIRENAERLLMGVDPFEDEDLDQAPRAIRMTVGVCLCCGAPTKGGKFAPGHDSKYRSRLRKDAADGSIEAAQKIRDLGWENHR